LYGISKANEKRGERRESKIFLTFAGSECKRKCKRKRDFSLRRPTALQEQSGKKRLGLLRSK
jgi:hypothetical protein